MVADSASISSTSSETETCTSSSSPPSTSSSLDQTSATSADASISPSEIDPNLSPSERSSKAIQSKEKGNKLFLSQNFLEAKAAYSEAIALDPSIPTYYNNRAFCEFKLEQHGLAIEDSTKALDLDPKNSKAFYRRAQCNLAILNPKQALLDFKQALKLEPNNKSIKAFVEDTTKLQRRLAFEKAIKSNQGSKGWETAIAHLKNGTGGGEISKSYKGPILKDGDDDQEPFKKSGIEEEDEKHLLTNKDAWGKHMGKIDQTFVEEMIQFFKDGGRLPQRYAWQISELKQKEKGKEWSFRLERKYLSSTLRSSFQILENLPSISKSVLGAQKEFMKEESLVEYQVPKGQTVDVVGDTHGQVSIYTFQGTNDLR